MANTGGIYPWSRTAATNATADSTVNWAEGQSPSTINDSARAMMASIAKWRDDIAGAIQTSGTSTAYTLSSFQDFDSLSDMSGQIIAFTPHTTNGATVTLDVDSLGAKPLRSAPNVELQPGTLVEGTPYTALYNNSDGAFYLFGLGINTYSVPLGTTLEYWGTSAPNSAFAFPYGQAISRTTYASLFSLFGTTYGSGDGSTTFNIPDVRGRVTACLDNMGGSAASRLTSTYFGTAPTALGAAGGAQDQTLITANLPPYTPSGSVSTTTSGTDGVVQNSGPVNIGGTGSGGTLQAIGSTSTFTGNAQGGTSSPITTLPPTILCNRILRII